MDLTALTLRTFTKTPWGWINYAASVLADNSESSVEEARKQNFAQICQMIDASPLAKTPDADTTMHVEEKIILQNLDTGEELHTQVLPEYDIEFWEMSPTEG